MFFSNNRQTKLWFHSFLTTEKTNSDFMSCLTKPSYEFILFLTTRPTKKFQIPYEPPLRARARRAIIHSLFFGGPGGAHFFPRLLLGLQKQVKT